ncbi:2-phytyl-1,4-beta-naphthoquinone methyltransferase, chloroplastic [Glycine max]|nr:2-phytyl-1,4-beta-naphthoquinone methyltransferase, chloroplastic [Glycine max]
MAMTFVPSTSSSFRPTLIRCANSNERRALFSRIAPVYDNLNDLLSLGQHRIWKRMAVSWTGAKMGGPCVGCVLWKWGFVLSLVRSSWLSWQGSAIVCLISAGITFKELLHKYRSSFAIVLYLSTIGDMGRFNGLLQDRWVEGDALDLPFSDGWFDAITMGYGLRNVVDKQKAMQEIFRVLKTGNPHEWMIDNIVVPVATGYGLSEEYRYLKSSIREFLTGKELEKLALEVGFSAARHYEIGGGLMGCLVAKR